MAVKSPTDQAKPEPPKQPEAHKPPTLQPLDQSSQSVLVQDTVAGALIEVFVGDPPTALASATASGARTRVALPHRLSPGEKVRATQTTAKHRSGFGPPIVVDHNYVTYHHDNARTGWNALEKDLNLATVRPKVFGLLFSQPVDQEFHAQPLYVRNVEIPGKGSHNVVYVATEAATVYAFDADSKQPALWVRPLIDSSHGEVNVSPPDVGCPNGYGLHYGTTSTPVIDRTSNTLYVTCVFKVASSKQIFWRLHALDITTGQDQPGGPKLITAQVSYGGKTIDLVPDHQGQRPGLLLDRGVLYIGFAGRCYDIQPYYGWVLAYDADIPSTPPFLNQVAVFNASPDSGGAGIWGGGFGLAADDGGSVYVVTGNGQFTVTGSNPGASYGDGVLKLQLPPAGARPGPMVLADFFTPWDWSVLTAGDADLGSAGTMLLPDQQGGHPHELVVCGKSGKIYLIDRDRMGGYTAGGPDNVVQPPFQPFTPRDGDYVFGGPAYYQDSTGQSIYYCATGDRLMRFSLTNGLLLTAPAASAVGAVPGGAPVPAVSSDGVRAGTGIVWCVQDSPGEAGQPLRLTAYDASSLSLLYQELAGSWPVISGSWMVPTVIDGKVYVGSSDRLSVFGTLPKVHPDHKMLKEHALEKAGLKEMLPEKTPKELSEGGGMSPFEHPLAPRITQLESRVAELSHFIQKELRPDLSKGALGEEADGDQGTSA